MIPDAGYLDAAAERVSPRKLAGIAFVALLHVAIIYALVNGLGEQTVQVLHAPLQVRIIEETPPPKLAPPPPPPQVVKLPKPYIPPPLIRVARRPRPVPVIARVTVQKPPAPAPAPVPVPAARPSAARAAGLDTSQSCAAPQYPQDAEDMEQTGISVLQFLIGTDGSVEKAEVASSSGHDELDQAALQALAQCRFKPALGADGQPQEAWTRIRYVWTLN